MKNLNITFSDEDFKKLEKKKEEMKIEGKISSWEEFILNLAGIK